MRRLLLHILLFIIPLVLVVYFLPVDRRQLFIQLKEDCSYHGIWFYDRVHQNETPANIIFLGSSHTVNGIMDDAIQRKINLPSVHVVNFGYCRYGTNIYYVLLKEILRAKRPGILFLEVREDESRYSHPVFPYIADARDIFLATPFFNRDMVRDYYNSFLFRLKVLKVQYFKRDSAVEARTGEFGYMGSADTASKSYLAKIRSDNAKPRTQLPSLERNFYMTYPRIYLKRLSELCIENKIRLCFLYIPQYGSACKEPREMAAYAGYGDVLIPPGEIFEDQDNWFDENHLNRAGATKLSEWVADRLTSPGMKFSLTGEPGKK